MSTKRRVYWTRLSIVENYHGPVRKDLRSLNGECRGLYKTKKELLEMDGLQDDTFDDGTWWHEIPIKVEIKRT